jgi:hypothetical protein
MSIGTHAHTHTPMNRPRFLPSFVIDHSISFCIELRKTRKSAICRILFQYHRTSLSRLAQRWRSNVAFNWRYRTFWHMHELILRSAPDCISFYTWLLRCIVPFTIIIVCLFPLLSKIPPLWSSGQFLATDPEVPGLIPGATRFSEK